MGVWRELPLVPRAESGVGRSCGHGSQGGGAARTVRRRGRGAPGV